MKKWLLAFGACFCYIFLNSPLAAQEIKPDQVLIIANSQNPDSARLAHVYARERNIPARNILLLDLPNREEITRNHYNRNIASPVEKFLRMLKLEQKIKILVTIYGVPLKVGPIQPTAFQRARAEQLKQKYFETYAEIETQYRDLETLAGIPTTLPTVLAGKDRIDLFVKSFSQFTDRVQTIYQRAITKIQNINDPAERERAAGKFMKLKQTLEGGLAIVQIMKKNPASRNQAFLDRIEAMENEYYGLLGTLPDKRDLDKTYRLAGELGGLFLKLRTIHEDFSRLMQTDSLSAVDSELTLALWKEPVLAGRLPNGLNPRFAHNPMVFGKGPILMVSRLDGPTPPNRRTNDPGQYRHRTKTNRPGGNLLYRCPGN